MVIITIKKYNTNNYNSIIIDETLIKINSLRSRVPMQTLSMLCNTSMTKKNRT